MSAPDPIRVIVIGNSNSIMATSYSHVLARRPGISLRNFSIGGVTNIVLLHILANPEADFSRADYIIIELAVIESLVLRTDGNYAPADSGKNIDIFMKCLRDISRAQVVFLILPTISGLLEPARHCTEQHYIAYAHRCGAAILNAFQIARDLCELDRKGADPKFLASMFKLGSAIGLYNPELFAFEAMVLQTSVERHGVSIGTKGFGLQVFYDSIHISRVFHGLIGEMLYKWMCEEVRPAPAADRVSHGFPVVRAPVVDIDKIEIVSYRNSLIARDLRILQSDQTMVLRCPVDYRAVSILVNEYKTSAFLNLSSPIGNVSVDVSFGRGAPAWVAKTVRIEADIGGGDIQLTVATRPCYGAGATRPKFLATGHEPVRGIAEIGEVILVKQDCKSPPRAFEGGQPPMIERLDWAITMARDVGTISARTAVGMKEHNIVAPNSLLSVGQEDDVYTLRARMLISSHDFKAAAVQIKKGLRKRPDNHTLIDLGAALSGVMAFETHSAGSGVEASLIHDLGLTPADRPSFTLPQGAQLHTVHTYFGTIVYADLGAGRIRHGKSDEVPQNLFLVQCGDEAVFVRSDTAGRCIAVALRPEGPHALQSTYLSRPGGDPITSLTVIPVMNGAREKFGLRGSGLFICAELRGELTLSRLRLGPWERFSIE